MVIKQGFPRKSTIFLLTSSNPTFCGPCYIWVHVNQFEPNLNFLGKAGMFSWIPIFLWSLLNILGDFKISPYKEDFSSYLSFKKNNLESLFFMCLLLSLRKVFKNIQHLILPISETKIICLYNRITLIGHNGDGECNKKHRKKKIMYASNYWNVTQN